MKHNNRESGSPWKMCLSGSLCFYMPTYMCLVVIQMKKNPKTLPDKPPPLMWTLKFYCLFRQGKNKYFLKCVTDLVKLTQNGSAGSLIRTIGRTLKVLSLGLWSNSHQHFSLLISHAVEVCWLQQKSHKLGYSWVYDNLQNRTMECCLPWISSHSLNVPVWSQELLV